MTKYSFTIQGITSLLMHADNIVGAEEVEKFRLDQNQKKNKGTKGSDRDPVWTWTTYLYSDGNNIAFPIASLQRALSEAGKQIKIGKSSLKETVMTTIMIDGIDTDGEMLDFKNGNPPKNIPINKIIDMANDTKATFLDHINLAKSMGFELDVRRAKINNGKHIRVRPRFRNWEVTGTLTVTDDDAIGFEHLKTLFEIAGSRKGVGDWRPSSVKPGKFGMFTATVKKASK